MPFNLATSAMLSSLDVGCGVIKDSINFFGINFFCIMR